MSLTRDGISLTPPTIGRILHYTLTARDVGRLGEKNSLHIRSHAEFPQPGTVVPFLVNRIDDDGSVSGTIFTGAPEGVLWIYRVKFAPDRFAEGCWSWPPRN